MLVPRRLYRNLRSEGAPDCPADLRMAHGAVAWRLPNGVQRDRISVPWKHFSAAWKTGGGFFRAMEKVGWIFP